MLVIVSQQTNVIVIEAKSERQENAHAVHKALLDKAYVLHEFLPPQTRMNGSSSECISLSGRIWKPITFQTQAVRFQLGVRMVKTKSSPLPITVKINSK